MVAARRGERCQVERDRIQAWLGDALPVFKVVDVLARRGVKVPERTLHRLCAQELGHGKHATTVRVADGRPAGELQVAFGRVGYLVDAGGRRRLLRALILTAVLPRHMFMWLPHRETLEDVIAGCEAARSVDTEADERRACRPL